MNIVLVWIFPQRPSKAATSKMNSAVMQLFWPPCTTPLGGGGGEMSSPAHLFGTGPLISMSAAATPALCGSSTRTPWWAPDCMKHWCQCQYCPYNVVSLLLMDAPWLLLAVDIPQLFFFFGGGGEDNLSTWHAQVTNIPWLFWKVTERASPFLPLLPWMSSFMLLCKYNFAIVSDCVWRSRSCVCLLSLMRH